MLPESNLTPPKVTPRCYSLSITPGGGYTLTPKITLTQLPHPRRHHFGERLRASPSLLDGADASSREDLSAFERTFSANDLLENLSVNEPGSADSSLNKKRKKRQKEDLGDLLIPTPKRVPMFVNEAIRFLRVQGEYEYMYRRAILC